MSAVITHLEDLSYGVTYEVVLRSGEQFRGELATVGNRSALGRVARFALADGDKRSEHAVDFESATPVT